MMFKKGSFEVGGTIYPVAIKVGVQRRQGRSMEFVNVSHCIGIIFCEFIP